MFLAAFGFTLEVVGIVCFTWDQMGVGVTSFASGLALFCFVTSVCDETRAWTGLNPINDLCRKLHCNSPVNIGAYLPPARAHGIGTPDDATDSQKNESPNSCRGKRAY